MARDHRGKHARFQHRNSRGQFAVREVIVISDEEDVRSPRNDEARGKRNTGESSKARAGKKNPRSGDTENSKVPNNSNEWDCSFSYSDMEEELGPVSMVRVLVDVANDDATKKIKQRANKLTSRIDGSFETLFVDMKHGVLKEAGQRKQGAMQHMRELFESAKDDAKKHVINEATKTCRDLDQFFDTLFVEVEHEVLKPLERKNKKTKK